MRRASVKEATSFIQNSQIVVDALLGTGQRDAPRGEVAKLIKLLNKAKNGLQSIISLDVPSGINASSGAIYSPHIEADLTVTVEFVKRGMLQYPARSACGRIEVISAGIKANKAAQYTMLTPQTLPKLPPRAMSSHKNNFGKVLVMGGSSEYPGAPVLSAHAALRSGAGTVTLASPAEQSFYGLWPEIIRLPLSCDKGYFSQEDLKEIQAKLNLYDVFVLGPGMGQKKETSLFFAEILAILKKSNKTVILDADGLNLLAAESKRGIKLKNFILTPHAGELSRLLSCNKKIIDQDRYKAARNLWEKYDSVSLLKGALSIIYKNKQGFVNTSGNPFMATAGSGDVLCGIIAAFCAQKLDNFNAAKLGAYVHGKSADIARQGGMSTLVASDIINFLPQALSDFI